MAEHDFVDVFGGNPGIGQSLAGDPHDEALDGLAGELAEGRVRPSHDAGGHNRSPDCVIWLTCLLDCALCRIFVVFT